MFFQGVSIEVPNEKDNAIEKKQLQIMYHKYVSKKNKIKSVKSNNTIVIFGCILHTTTFGSMLSPLHLDIFNIERTLKGSFKDKVKKKYDSMNLQVNTEIHKPCENHLDLPLNVGNEAVKVFEDTYLLLYLPFDKYELNIPPNGLTEKKTQVINETNN